MKPLGMHGPSFMNVPGFPVLPGTGANYYPNDQSARLVWYHDHAMGITRLNAYSGLASGYIITDDFESGLVSKGLLPDLIGVPLIIQDKGFAHEASYLASLKARGLRVAETAVDLGPEQTVQATLDLARGLGLANLCLRLFYRSGRGLTLADHGLFLCAKLGALRFQLRTQRRLA